LKVLFLFHSRAYMSMSRDYLVAHVGGRSFEVEWPELAAYLVNKHSRAIKIDEYGFGYEAEMPESAATALQYMIFRTTPPSRKELDEIAASGVTPLHSLRRQVGAFSGDMTVEDLFLKDAVGNGFNISFRDFPRLVLYSNRGARLRVLFNTEGVRPEFLRRALSGELTGNETAMLRGISLLRKDAQAKYMGLLSNGLLTVDALAKTLRKAASSAKERDVWHPIVEWLRENGYCREASEVFARKTVVEG